MPPLAALMETLRANNVSGERVLLALFLARAARDTVSLVQRDGWRALVKRSLSVLISFSKAAIPGVAGLVAGEERAALQELEDDLLGEGDAHANVAVPKKGVSAKAVEAELLGFVDAQTNFNSGKQMGGIYHTAVSDLSAFQGRVWSKYACSNALYPGVFPSVRKFEAELVKMVVGIVHGEECGAVGLLASSGTEAILLAALSYRETGRARGITRPRIIAGISAPPAIFKACHYFGIELVKVPVDASLRLTAAAVAPAIDANTVAIYASAPSFSHGVVDEIEQLSELALSKGIGLHVDNCLGGFLLSYMSKEGLFTKPWDFAVRGVTTMSVDVHKYGMAPKGASICVFRDPAQRAATYVPSSEGCEGLYVTPTLQGSRSGANMAVAWATVVHIGDDGYRKLARDITASYRKLVKAVETIPEIGLATDAELGVVPLVGKGKLDIYALATLMTQKGWGIFTGQKPKTLSLPIAEQAGATLDEMIKDLHESVEHLRKHPDTKPAGNAALCGGGHFCGRRAPLLAWRWAPF